MTFKLIRWTRKREKHWISRFFKVVVLCEYIPYEDATRQVVFCFLQARASGWPQSPLQVSVDDDRSVPDKDRKLSPLRRSCHSEQNALDRGIFPTPQATSTVKADSPYPCVRTYKAASGEVNKMEPVETFDPRNCKARKTRKCSARRRAHSASIPPDAFAVLGSKQRRAAAMGDKSHKSSATPEEAERFRISVPYNLSL